MRPLLLLLAIFAAVALFVAATRPAEIVYANLLMGPGGVHGPSWIWEGYQSRGAAEHAADKARLEAEQTQLRVVEVAVPFARIGSGR